MQAINHMAVALVTKKAVPEAPLLGLLVATEAIELLWLGLNIAGIEYVEVAPPGTHITDVHLAHMPFSHSVASSVILAAFVFAVILWRGGRTSLAVASAMAAALFSHILADLAVHARDIPFWPLTDTAKYGTGIGLSLPLAALALETAFGLCCWWIFGGNRKLLAVFVVSALVALPSYLPRDLGLGAPMTPETFPYLIGLQILLTMGFVWLFARGQRASIDSGQ